MLRDHGTIRERGRGRVARFGCKDWHADHADSEYVAAMHPGVARTLALLLDDLARDADPSIAVIATREALVLDGLAVARALVPASLSVTESTEEKRDDRGEHGVARSRAVPEGIRG